MYNYHIGSRTIGSSGLSLVLVVYDSIREGHLLLLAINSVARSKPRILGFFHSPVNFHVHRPAYPRSLPLTPVHVDVRISMGE